MKRKSKNKRTIFLLLVSLIIIIAIVIVFLINTFAATYRFEHDSDKIDMSNNSITYKYYDNDNKMYGDKTYTISDNWFSSMRLWYWDCRDSTIGTNTTIYGPYTWLPAGDYKVHFHLTPEGWYSLKYWDICVNFDNDGSSNGHTGFRDKMDFSNCEIPGTDTSVKNITCGGNETGGDLWYTISTNGNTADYELRLFFSTDWTDVEKPSYDASLKSRLFTDLTIESLNSNTISFDADGGTLNNKSTGKLTDTYWGKDRENVSVPTREGYTFDGWYGYSKATNTTTSRSGLKFNNKSETVKIWDENGKPTGNIKEVSYNDYTVYAHWTPAKYTLGFNADGGVLPTGGNIGLHGNLSTDRKTGNITVTYNDPSFSIMDNDCPSREGYSFNGWYRAYWKDDGLLDHLEQIYDSSGKAVESSLWGYWDNNWHYKYAGNETLWAGWTRNSYYLDLNATYNHSTNLGGLKDGGLDLGTCDVYDDNGNIWDKAIGVTDYYKQVPYNYTYEVKNVNKNAGYIFCDNGTLKGSIKAGNTEARIYVYDNYSLAYYDGNGATGGQYINGMLFLLKKDRQ